MRSWSNKQLSLSVAGLSMVGLALSIISLYHHTQARYGLKIGDSFCNINETFNCDAVNESQWSMFLGVPLASYGIFFYLCLFLFALLTAGSKVVSFKPARDALLLLSLIASIFSLFLFGVSEIVIGTICIVCVGMYLVNFGLLLVSSLAVRPVHFGSSVREGFVALTTFFLSALGIEESKEGGDRGASARTAIAVIALVFTLSVAASDSIFVRLLAAAQEQRQNGSQTGEAVALWKKATPITFPFLESERIDRQHVKGPVGAPIELVEFSDFQCPACRNFHNVLEDLLPKFKNNVRVVHKNYPLDSTCNLAVQGPGHQGACYMAYASECAAEQDRYWEAIDALFQVKLDHRLGVKNAITEVDKVMQALGLDMQGFKECVAAPRTKQRIADDIRDGDMLGLRATPTIWLNQKQVVVASGDVIKALFEHIMAGHAS